MSGLIPTCWRKFDVWIAEQVIAKLQDYQRLGVDAFIYYASMGLGMDEQKRSMELFCGEVMPAFR